MKLFYITEVAFKSLYFTPTHIEYSWNRVPGMLNQVLGWRKALAYLFPELAPSQQQRATSFILSSVSQSCWANNILRTICTTAVRCRAEISS